MFYCKHCGTSNKDLRYLLNGSCSKSPTKKHEAYEGSSTDIFYCKHCGTSNKDLRYLLNGSCSKSPTKKHQVL